MIEIRDLLLKFNNLLISEEVKKETIRNIISEIINIQINTEDIIIKNNIIYLNIKPIYKNEIYLKQEKIFLRLQRDLGKKIPNRIF